jgi:class 3 adenylate cyclase
VARVAAESGHPLRLRIGINTGPVVAGVIGKKKFAYDLWGDAVNTASRMESHGLVDQIQVSDSTYQRIRHAFELETRGRIAVKGKGELETYLLQGRRR